VDFFRTVTRRAACGAGPAPAYPFAAELGTHLASLLARSAAMRPAQLDSLLARWQSECRGQGLAELKAAAPARRTLGTPCRRTDTLRGLTSELAFQATRHLRDRAPLQRSVTLYVGPPNSGKTHAAFERWPSL